MAGPEQTNHNCFEKFTRNIDYIHADLIASEFLSLIGVRWHAAWVQ